MNQNDLSLLIIAGGKSSRLGTDKRQLKLGDSSLLEHTLAKGRKAGFKEVFLCAEGPSPFLTELAGKYGATLLFDETQGLGPVSGLARGLASITKSWALAIAGDMPFLDLEELCRFGATLPTSELALLPVAKGRLQPLAAFYQRETAAYFQRDLHGGVRKIRQVLEAFPCSQREYTGSPSHFFNINTPADWRLAQGRFANLRRKVPVVSITAPASGTGKTTFIEKLLPRLRERGIRAGVIKSDSHGFNLDMEGKDSCRFSQAGAESVAVISPRAGSSPRRQTSGLTLKLLPTRWRALTCSSQRAAAMSPCPPFPSGGARALPLREKMWQQYSLLNHMQKQLHFTNTI